MNNTNRESLCGLARKLALVLEYDGTGFAGFQRQSAARSVQGVIEERLSTITSQRLTVTGAGRTDAGVHALAQVVSFETTTRLDDATLFRALNATLPDDLAVVGLRRVESEFSARYSAIRRSYRYRIWLSEARSPLLRHQTWQRHGKLDLAAMREATSLLIGKRDYRALSGASINAPGQEGRTTVRTIFKASIDGSRDGREIAFLIEANAFLPHMVRNIVGSLVEIGQHRLSIESFLMAIEAGERKLLGPTAPASGLCLTDVIYPSWRSSQHVRPESETTTER